MRIGVLMLLLTGLPVLFGSGEDSGSLPASGSGSGSVDDGEKWVIYWAGEEDPREVPLEEHGLRFLGPVENLKKVYTVAPLSEEGLAILQSRDSKKLKPYQRRESFLKNYWKEKGAPLPDLLWADKVKKEPISVEMPPVPAIDDSRLTSQWNMHNTGQSEGVSGEDANLFAAWLDGVSGKSVVIGIVDEGVDRRHQDLSDNYRPPLSFNFIENMNDPTPDSNETHGTEVAGIAAAAKNGFGVVGTAFEAGIASLRILEEQNNSSFVTNSTIAETLNHKKQDIDIYNNSWAFRPSRGFNSVGFANVTTEALFQTALENGVNDGRGGRGAVYVWAAGNSNASGGNVNHDRIINSPYTIAVGSVGNEGRHSPFSNRGAALHLVAPSSGNRAGITTTTFEEDSLSGRRFTHRTNFGGTSASAPLVSGVIALMLEANPDLGWRDVQHILLTTAVQVDRDHPDWTFNAAGRHINHTYGFGRVDAASAVLLAREWENVPPVRETIHVAGELDFTIPEDVNSKLSLPIEVDTPLLLEHVQVSVTLEEQDDWGDLEITLRSPGGTESILLEPFNSATQPSEDTWLFSTLRNWGELSTGAWTLEIRNAIAGPSADPGMIREWALMLRGTEPSEKSQSQPVLDTLRVRSLETLATVDVIEEQGLAGEESLHLLSLYRPPEGDAWVDEEGRINVITDPGFRGVLNIFYTVADSAGRTAFGTLEFVNPRPTAMSERVGALPGRTRSLFPLDNDTHPDPVRLSITDFTQPSSGSIRQINDSILQWIPETEASPVTSTEFSYTISDTAGETDSTSMEIFIAQTEDFAVRFNDPGSHARVDPHPSINLRHSMTLEAWIYPESYGQLGISGFGRIMDKDSFLLFLNEDSGFYAPSSLVFFLRMADGTSTARYSNAGTIPLNAWTHVAATYNGESDVRLYINGEPVPANNPANKPDSPDRSIFSPLLGPLQENEEEPLFMGQNRDGDRAFEGRIDEVRLWNRVRSPADIQNAYNQPLKGFESGLVGYWPMIEARRDRLVERSGRSREARLVNPLWAEGRVPGLGDDLFLETPFLDENWRSNNWFGLFFEDPDSPWVYHRDHGWLYAFGDSTDNLHLYDPVLETWLWTTSEKYPFLYRYDLDQWTFFDTGSGDPRFFFNFSSGVWEAVSRPAL